MMSIRSKRILFTVALALTTVGLTSCYLPTRPLKHVAADRLAAPSWMQERKIAVDPFIITSYERVREKGGVANVYIEGGQVLWSFDFEEREAPTPRNPVALHMASRDLAPNVIYMARPCQYTGLINTAKGPIDMPCPNELWTTSRYSPAVLKGQNDALNDIKKRYSLKGFHLIGHGDGGGMAIHLAAARDDILSIRTAAGVLDTDRMTEVRNLRTSQYFVDETSINPVTQAKRLAKIPQHHFIGVWDEVIPTALAESFQAAAGSSSCIRVSSVDGVTYGKGWVNRWPGLLDLPVDCNKAP